MPLDHTIAILTVAGSWIAGAGSIVAAIVALRLALRAEKVRLNVKFGLRIMYSEDQPNQELVEIAVTNVGERPATINSIGWCVGMRKGKRAAIQTFSHSLSDHCPKRIDYGETASFRIFLSDDSDWLERFVKDFGADNSEYPVKTLRAQIFTSTGHIEYVAPESSFLERLQRENVN